MRKIILILTLLCSTSSLMAQVHISIRQQESPHQVVIRMNKEETTIRSIRFYLPLHIIKTIDDVVRYSQAIYYTEHDNEDIGVNLHTDFIDKKGLFYQGDKRNFFKKDKSENYIIMAPHFLNEDSPYQKIYASYLEKIQRLGKDSLHIGTIAELKKTDPKTLKILEGDSIFLVYRVEEGFYSCPMAVEAK